MASQVDICNRALIKLGAGQITAITDNTKAARVLSGLWDSVRQAELSKRFWIFALTRTSMPALATTPEWGFGYQYQLPVDFLKLVQINDTFIPPGLMDYRNGDDSPYAIEGKSLLTNFGPPLKIRYIRDVTDTGTFDALFCDMLASRLAVEACYSITQSREGQNAAKEDYKSSSREASISNAIAKPPQGLLDDSWMMGRL
ncbi:hypothetical protein UFOVP1356_31 [uncultured Caudovirales phage]|uniref:Tail tubular protein Gp11 n=1 Tax=uncultured Caudovirales phage TaxID=2100421 RepID=A0A6J5S3G7_9CAUD|nr:hypothetical protein UFOVP1356_31 [uncultured Caudovirales phage]